LSTDTESSKKTVLEFFELAFVERKPVDAAERYMGEYTQHNPDVADGKDAFIAAIGGMFAAFPDFSIDRKRVIAEGDLVAIHSHVRMNKEDRGMAVADIFRVADGKIVEHWDILQPVPETPANSNTMF